MLIMAQGTGGQNEGEAVVSEQIKQGGVLFLSTRKTGGQRFSYPRNEVLHPIHSANNETGHIDKNPCGKQILVEILSFPVSTVHKLKMKIIYYNKLEEAILKKKTNKAERSQSVLHNKSKKDVQNLFWNTLLDCLCNCSIIVTRRCTLTAQGLGLHFVLGINIYAIFINVWSLQLTSERRDRVNCCF